MEGGRLEAEVPQEEEAFDEEEYLLSGAPDSMKCPISFVLMTSAVTAADGHSYQQDALQQHIAYTRERTYVQVGHTCS